MRREAIRAWIAPAVALFAWVMDRLHPLPTGQTDQAILPLLIIAGAMAAKAIADKKAKNSAEKQAAQNATAQASTARTDAQAAQNRRRTALAALAKALHREGMFGDALNTDAAAPARSPATASWFGNSDDWTLAGVPEIKTGGSLWLAGAQGAANGVASYYGAPTSSPVMPGRTNQTQPPTGTYFGGDSGLKPGAFAPRNYDPNAFKLGH